MVHFCNRTLWCGLLQNFLELNGAGSSWTVQFWNMSGWFRNRSDAGHVWITGFREKFVLILVESNSEKRETDKDPGGSGFWKQKNSC